MPELSMTIDELFEAFAANAEKASVEYVGKFVEITGIVTWVLPVSTGNRSVISLGVDQDSSIRLLSASVIDREPWSIMSKGSTTTVKGTLGPDGISLTDAVIVATSGDSALQITATDLMKEFVADRKKASDKFFLRQFRMSGTIEMANEGEVWLKVDGLPKASVICSFVLQFDASHPIHSKFKPNDVIHVLAMNPYWYEFVPPPYESLVKVLMALPYTPRE
ncbi:MAG: OB-fold protein [Planctomycetales bacterium]